jgi:hypothetical protein
VERHTTKPFDEYVLGQKTTYPFGYAEFSTLGAVARRLFPDRYTWKDLTGVPTPLGWVRQFNGVQKRVADAGAQAWVAEAEAILAR